MKFEYKLVSSMCKVLADREPQPALSQPTLAGLRGETVSFQLAYYWEDWSKSYAQVQAECSLPIRLRSVELVPCAYPCHPRRDPGYLATVPGLYPDLLRDLSPQGLPLVSGQWRSLWVDLDLRGAAPGGHSLSLTLLREGEELCQVQLACQVLDVDLPKLPIPHTEWFHSDCLANYYQTEVFSEEYWRIVAEFVKTAAQHKCNMLLTPVFTPPLDTAVGGERRTVQLVDVAVSGGKYSFGFEKLRRWVKMALDCGMEYLEISHLFSQWGAVAAPKVMATVDGTYCQLFGWDTDGGGEEYGGFLRQFLRELKEELRSLDVLEKTYFHISDEPSMEQIGTYRRAWESVKEELAGCRMMDALSDHAFYKEGLVQQPVCALDHIQPFLQDRPEYLWGYYCTAQCVDVPNRFIVQPGSRTRILGPLLYQYQLDGFLHWGYNFYNSQYSIRPIDPYQTTDSDAAFPSGDPFLVYPGPDGKPEASIRLMLMDEAMSDYCALLALEQLAGRDRALACLKEDLAFDRFPQEEAYLLELRQRVHSAIGTALNSKK